MHIVREAHLRGVLLCRSLALFANRRSIVNGSLLVVTAMALEMMSFLMLLFLLALRLGVLKLQLLLMFLGGRPIDKVSHERGSATHL